VSPIPPSASPLVGAPDVARLTPCGRPADRVPNLSGQYT